MMRKHASVPTMPWDGYSFAGLQTPSAPHVFSEEAPDTFDLGDGDRYLKRFSEAELYGLLPAPLQAPESGLLHTPDGQDQDGLQGAGPIRGRRVDVNPRKPRKHAERHNQVEGAYRRRGVDALSTLYEAAGQNNLGLDGKTFIKQIQRRKPCAQPTKEEQLLFAKHVLEQAFAEISRLRAENAQLKGVSKDPDVANLGVSVDEGGREDVLE